MMAFGWRIGHMFSISNVVPFHDHWRSWSDCLHASDRKWQSVDWRLSASVIFPLTYGQPDLTLYAIRKARPARDFGRNQYAGVK